MSNRDELDAFMMLFRAMSGESNVIEHMEAEGQQRAVNNTMVAKKMRPSRQDWEQLGFAFSDISGDDVLCKATLPEGWIIVPTDHSMWNDIIDQNGRKRGSMFYKSSFYDRDAHMDLNCRYGVRSDYIGDDYSTTEIYFGNDSEKLFVAGQVHRQKNATREEILAEYDEMDRLKAMAKKFGDENYPDWKNVHAYWDDEKEKTHGTSRIRK